MDRRNWMPSQSIKLVGAVGIESTWSRNFKDLRGSTRNTKTLKSHVKACTRFLIAPSKRPRKFHSPLFHESRLRNY